MFKSGDKVIRAVHNYFVISPAMDKAFAKKRVLTVLECGICRDLQNIPYIKLKEIPGVWDADKFRLVTDKDNITINQEEI